MDRLFTSPPQRPNRLVVRGLLVLLVLVGVVGGAWVWTQGSGLSEGLVRALTGRGRVLALDADVRERDVDGVEWVHPGPFAAELESDDPGPLLARMRAENVRGFLVAGGSDPGGVASRFASYDHVDGFVGVYLDAAMALYEPGVSADLGESARITPAVARRILEGAANPRMASFPEPLRRIRNVEVMVLLRDGGRARLWRSARGSSVASALVTAASVARERWRERERALGGPLETQIDQLRVEVSLLEEDGTLGTTAPAFLERVFKPEHGVAYARAGAWRYLLPDATAREGRGSATRAYEALFRDNALAEDSMRRADMRFYRLAVTQLGIGDDDGISPIAPPDTSPEPESGDSD